MSSFLEIVYALYFKDLFGNIKIGLKLKIFENSNNELYCEEVFGYPFELECKLLGSREKYDKKTNDLIPLYLNKDENDTSFGLLSIEILDDPENKSKIFIEKISDIKVFNNLDKNVFDFKVLSKIIYEYRISISLLDSYRFQFDVTTLKLKNL